MDENALAVALATVQPDIRSTETRAKDFNKHVLSLGDNKDKHVYRGKMDEDILYSLAPLVAPETKQNTFAATFENVIQQDSIKRLLKEWFDSDDCPWGEDTNLKNVDEMVDYIIDNGPYFHFKPIYQIASNILKCEIQMLAVSEVGIKEYPITEICKYGENYHDSRHIKLYVYQPYSDESDYYCTAFWYSAAQAKAVKRRYTPKKYVSSKYLEEDEKPLYNLPQYVLNCLRWKPNFKTKVL